MNIDWTYDGCDTADQRAIDQLWETYQTELESKLAELSLEPPELGLAVVHHSDTDEWELQAVLHLTAQTLTASRVGDALELVFEETIADLVRALNEEFTRATEVSRRLQGLEAVLPLLQRNRAESRSYQFFFFLGPLMKSFATHVERELELLELEGALAVEELEVDDVLDEALLRAWDRFDQRPQLVPLDLWLLGLTDGVLDDLAQGVLLESLQSERDIALPEDDEQTSPITWLERAAYPETVEMGELLPGEPGVEAWDRLDFETKQTKLAELLSYLSRDHRQLLVLNAVEGFEPEQIAALQERSPDEVKAGLKESRKRLSAALRNLQSPIA